MNTPTTTSTAPTTSAALGATGQTPRTDPLLSKDAFLNLMMAQLKSQDPLNPSDPSQYLGQLAQLTTLEQETNIAQSAAQTATEQSANTSLSLLGRTVTYMDDNGNAVSGQVQKVEFGSSGATLTIDGVSGISPGSVMEVTQ